MKIPAPNYTQFPNVILDAMSEMGNAEWRIVCAICRKTFGWQKREDLLSLSQFKKLTNLSRQGVITGIENAIEHGYIARIPHGQSFKYRLIVEESNNLTSQATGLVEAKTSQASRPELVKLVDTQKKGKKVVKESNNAGQDNLHSSDNAASDFSKLVKIYENNIGLITPIMAEELKDALKDYPFEWIETSIIETVKAGVRNWNYALAILKRWRTGGKISLSGKKTNGRNLPDITIDTDGGCYA